VSSVLLANAILDACLPGLAATVTLRDRPSITGVYRSPSTGRIIELCTSSTHPAAGNARQVVSIDGKDMPAEADSDGVLWPVGMFGCVKQSMTLVGDPRDPRAIRFSDFGNTDLLEAVRPVATPDPGSIAGRYRSEMIGADATICESVEGPELHTRGRFGAATYRLQCLAEDIWRARQPGGAPWGGILSFNDSGFRFSTYNTRSLPFRRTR
jgi:hypothetical protein